MKRLSAYGSARHGQHRIHANGTQKRALSRHIRAAHQHHARIFIKLHAVADAPGICDQRMPESFPDKCPRGVFDEIRKWVGGMFERIGCQGKQSFHLRSYVDPGAHPAAPTKAPGFGGESNLERIKKWNIDEVREQAVTRINPVNDTRQLSNELRRRFRMFFKRRAELLQLGRREWFFFEKL